VSASSTAASAEDEYSSHSEIGHVNKGVAQVEKRSSIPIPRVNTQQQHSNNL
jgi:hypothetical protein